MLDFAMTAVLLGSIALIRLLILWCAGQVDAEE